MKLAIILVFVFLLLNVVNSAQERVVGDLVRGRARLGSFNVPFQLAPVVCVVSDGRRFKCSTCSSGILCDDAVLLTTVSCSAPDSFCDSITNQCTSVRPTNCATSTFKCPAAGYFPDIQNCDTYYFCTAAKTVEEYKCPINYVFDIAIKGCKRLVFPLDCVTMKCTKPMEFISYSKDTSIYVFCDNALLGHMFKCPTSQEFDKTTNLCKITCKREGMVAGPTSRDAYFCYRDGLNFKHMIMSCPLNYEYNASFECIPTPVKTLV